MAEETEEDAVKRHSFLSDKTWIRICEAFEKDIEADSTNCLSLLAPEDAITNELSLCLNFETPGMVWSGKEFRMGLSEAIIEDNKGDADEIFRAALSLRITILRLAHNLDMLSAVREATAVRTMLKGY